MQFQSPLYRKILLVASGMSPQVLTETLYALIHQEKPFIPDEIHLITTASGKEKALQTLLNKEYGYFYQFCRDYGFNEQAFPAENIHSIHNANGETLSDIKTVEENEWAADSIMALVRQLTSDPDATLHVSLAGGRKTMSYYTGYALSMFGRQQDQLSHVLVSEGYEFSDAFYYPTPSTHWIKSKSGELMDAGRAEVVLAQIPFIRLREGAPARFLQGVAGFSETVRRMAMRDEPKVMELDINQRVVILSGIRFDLRDHELAFAFLLMFVCDRLNTEEGAGLRVPTKDKPNRVTGHCYLEALCELRKVSFSDEWPILKSRLIDAEVKERTLNSLENGQMKYSFYNQRRNELLSIFKAELGKPLAEHYLPQPKEGRGGDHWLDLEKSDIHLV